MYSYADKITVSNPILFKGDNEMRNDNEVYSRDNRNDSESITIPTIRKLYFIAEKQLKH